MKAAGEALKPIKGLKKAGKADEAGEALKAKPAKVRRLEESGARAREECFSSRYLPRRNFSSPLFLFFSFSPPPPPPLSHLTNRST